MNNEYTESVRVVTVRLDNSGKLFRITFDEEGYVDTVQNDKGKYLVSTNASVKKIVNNQERLYNGLPCSGMVVTKIENVKY